MRAVRRILDLQPDVVHFHRLGQSNSLYLLQLLRGPDGPAIVGQYHGGKLTSGWLEHRILRAGLRQIQQALFSRQDDADLFLADGILDEEQVVIVNDKTTDLKMTSRPEARLASRMDGTPTFLWYSDLVAERDPMTAVLGFKLLLKAWPKAQLHMVYGGDDMLTQLRAYVIANPELAGHVHFQSQQLGPAREHVFNSADFLLQTDIEDGQEQTLIDAMACGVIPVLSDIPMYRRMVDNGRCGFLFPKGEPETMVKQLLKFSPGEIAGRAAVVHDWFEAAYSYDAMAGLLLDIYTEAIGKRMEAMATLGEAVTEGSG
jgi:glycosyltransferase involved in cell wall biosynthesis